MWGGGHEAASWRSLGRGLAAKREEGAGSRGSLVETGELRGPEADGDGEGRGGQEAFESTGEPRDP